MTYGTVSMLWFLFFVLAFGFGLGFWEFLAIQDEMKRQGSAALELAKTAGTPIHLAYSGLPLVLKRPLVRRWIFAGQMGFVIVAIAGWWTTSGLIAGALRALELELLYVAVGAAIGSGIWQLAGGSTA